MVDDAGAESGIASNVNNMDIYNYINKIKSSDSITDIEREQGRVAEEAFRRDKNIESEARKKNNNNERDKMIQRWEKNLKSRLFDVSGGLNCMHLLVE